MAPSSVASMDESLHLPPGFRFHPTDEEIITHYLAEKIIDPSFESVPIGEASFNQNEPWDLPGKAKMGENEWFFFSQRDRKYTTGMRSNRATASGYWKTTGKDKEIFKEKVDLVGMKKTLVFYRGRAPRGLKTNWVMHEYRLEDNCLQCYNQSTSTKNDWVVCKVYYKKHTDISTMHQAAERMNSSFVNDFLIEPPPSAPFTESPYFNNSRDKDMEETMVMSHFLHEETNLLRRASSTSNAEYFALRASGNLEQISSSIISASLDTGMSSERNMEDNDCFLSYDDDLYNGVEDMGFGGVWKF